MKSKSFEPLGHSNFRCGMNPVQIKRVYACYRHENDLLSKTVKMLKKAEKRLEIKVK